MSRAAKAKARKDELADAALETLGERGYARTSLREIAQHSRMTHGVVHYYFADKLELLAYCVGRYKETCAGKFDDALQARTGEGLRTAFTAELRRILEEETAQQRLWYDMRNQSRFEPSLREPVAAIDSRLQEMLSSLVQRYADLMGRSVVVEPLACYAALDGVFVRCLTLHHHGDAEAPARLEAQAGALLDALTR